MCHLLCGSLMGWDGPSTSSTTSLVTPWIVVEAATADGSWQVSILRQQMGNSSSAMTELYTGEIPLEAVRAAYSKPQTGLLEKMENEVAA